MRQILIASSSEDRASWDPVSGILRKSGYDVVAYEADKVAAGEVSLEISLSQDKIHGPAVWYDHRRLHLEKVAAAWFRRSTYFGPMQDKTRQLTLDMERRALQYSLWYGVPEQAWLNAPGRISHTGHKLTQLAVAQELGFAIPATVVTNVWSPIRRKLPKKVIFKPAYGLFYKGNRAMSLYTTPLHNTNTGLPDEHIPFPGIWQSYIPKKREWRITVVGQQVFDAAIYHADQTAKDDWRKHQHTSKIQFKHETFPADQKKKCLAFLKRFGLRYGAFDFIEDPDGTMVFLECNPNGQFGFIEDALGLPISLAIADELMSIARHVS